eukprot:Gb_09294 [translate_table: standard]
MLEPLGSIPSTVTVNSKPVQCCTDSTLIVRNRCPLLLNRKPQYEVLSRQLAGSLFQRKKIKTMPTKTYGKVRKWVSKIMVKLENGEEEMQGGGDKKTQELLVEIAMLQAEKVRVTEFMAERSAHLSQIADQANSEIDQIAEETMKGMDEAGFKINKKRPALSQLDHIGCPQYHEISSDGRKLHPEIKSDHKAAAIYGQLGLKLEGSILPHVAYTPLQVMESVEADAQACEEKLASARAEMERKEQTIDNIEKEMQKGRGDGLFFNTLFTPRKKWKEVSPEKQNITQLEADMLKEVTKQKIKSSFRRNLYLFLILILSLILIDAVASGNVEWPKLAIYSTLIVILIVQLTYETIFLSNANDVEDK